MGWGCGISNLSSGGSWINSIFHLLTSVLFWGAIIGGLYLLSKSMLSNNQSNSKPTATNALEILKTRYANGEISEAEYEKMKLNLM